MKKVIQFLTFLAIGLIVFLVVMERVGLDNINKAFLLFLGIEGLVMVVLSVLFLLIGILKWKLILKKMGYDFSYKKLAPLFALGFSISFLSPVALFGGEFFRAYFTRKRFPKINSETSFASVAVDKLIDATVFFVFLISGLLIFTFYGRFPNSIAGISLFITAGFFLAFMAVFYFKRLKKESLIEWLFNVFGINKRKLANDRGFDVLESEKQVFRFFSLKNKTFILAMLLAVLKYLVQFFACIVMVFFLTGHIAILKSWAAYGFTTLATLTPLPAMLGAFELGQGFAFSVLGFGFNVGTIFSMIWRGALLLLSLFGLIALIKYSADLAGEKLIKIFERK